MKNLNKDNLKYKILKDIFIFLNQSKYFSHIEFKNLNKISRNLRLKLLYLSKQISNYILKNNLTSITKNSLMKILNENFKDENFKIYSKNIELIKFYTILFVEKPCSHLTFYLFNNINEKIDFEDENLLSVIIKKTQKECIILNENLDVFVKRLNKFKEGEIFLYKHKNFMYSNLKQKVSLFFFTIILGYILIYNIPTNHIILEMNLSLHMKSNHSGRIISCKPKSSKGKIMIKNTKNINSKIGNTIINFIDYGLENKILKPGQNVKIYIIGPPLKNKIFENLKSSLKDVPLDVHINNSGNLIKINRTY